MADAHRSVYAYGDPAHPFIVSSLEQAIERANTEAAKTGEMQYVLRLDLGRPDLAPEILGQAAPA